MRTPPPPKKKKLVRHLSVTRRLQGSELFCQTITIPIDTTLSHVSVSEWAQSLWSSQGWCRRHLPPKTSGFKPQIERTKRNWAQLTRRNIIHKIPSWSSQRILWIPCMKQNKHIVISLSLTLRGSINEHIMPPYKFRWNLKCKAKARGNGTKQDRRFHCSIIFMHLEKYLALPLPSTVWASMAIKSTFPAVNLWFLAPK